MAGSPRSADFLDLTDNVRRRVRNLETGVHPTAAEQDYYDTYSPALIERTNAKFATPGGTTDERPRWLRRVGITQLIGVTTLASGVSIADLAAEELYGTLPSPARPLTDLTLRGVLNVAPHYFLYRVQTDGGLYVLKPAASGTGSAVTFAFYGSSWVVN